MDFDSPEVKWDPGLGTAAVIVMDKSTDIVYAIARSVGILSCMKAVASARRAVKARAGWRECIGAHGPSGRGRRLMKLICCEDVTKQVEGHTICALGDAAAWPIQGLIRRIFASEIENGGFKAHNIARDSQSPNASSSRGLN